MSAESVSNPESAGAASESELERKDRLALLFREAVQQQGPGVILIFEGVGVAGIVHTIHRLCQVLDPRHYDAHRFPEHKKGGANSSDRVPPLLEYWKRLPKFGDLAIFDGSYYTEAILADLGGKKRKALIQEIQSFERTLADNGYLVLKIRITRREKDLKKELKKERASILRKSLLQKRLKRLFKDYDDRVEDLQRLIRKTDAPHAAWFTPAPGDSREVARKVFDYLIARLEEALSLDSRTAVAEFDEAMERVRQMRRQGAV